MHAFVDHRRRLRAKSPLPLRAHRFLWHRHRYKILLDGCTSVPVFHAIVRDLTKTGLTEPMLCGAVANTYLNIVASKPPGAGWPDRGESRDGQLGLGGYAEVPEGILIGKLKQIKRETRGKLKGRSANKKKTQKLRKFDELLSNF